MPQLSIVVPCYNEADTIVPFLEALDAVSPALEGTPYEVVFVDDGSTDDTLAVLRELAEKRTEVEYVSLSRNFGKEAAMLAGLQQSEGQYTAVMDADLQDPPSLLPQMLHAVREEGYDCAATRRVNREGEPLVRSCFARLFYCCINAVSDTTIVDGARDFRLFTRPVREALLSMPEYNRFSKGLNEWVGFRTKWIEFDHVNRVAGKTKWSFWQLCKYSVEGIVGFTTAPLSLASMLGLFFVLFSFVAIVALCVRQLVWHSSVSGWTSMVCVLIFFCGIQLLCLGIIGQYLAKTYQEVKRRPHFVVREDTRRY